MKFKFLKENYTSTNLRNTTLNESRSLTESSNSVDFEAYITNLGKYNEGDLIGQWVHFPISESDFNQVLDDIGINDEYEEWFVTDYNCDVDAYDVLGEYPSFEDLNEFGELVENNAFKAILEYEGDSNFDYAKDIYESGDYSLYPGIDSWEDYAYQDVYEKGGVENLSEDTLKQNFNYEELGEEVDNDYFAQKDGDPETAGEVWCGNADASYKDIGYAYADAEGGPDEFLGIERYFDYQSYAKYLSEISSGGPTKFGFIIIYE